jgi:uncharacterized protein YjbJ (UPF0337 family)
MKASTNDEAKDQFHEVKGETNEKSRKLTNDPTLEGKDENKVGRVQRKIGVVNDIRKVKNQKASSSKGELP